MAPSSLDSRFSTLSSLSRNQKEMEIIIMSLNYSIYVLVASRRHEYVSVDPSICMTLHTSKYQHYARNAASICVFEQSSPLISTLNISARVSK